MSDKASTKPQALGIAALLALSLAHSFFLVSSQVLFKIAEFAPHNGIWEIVWIVVSNPTVLLSVLSFSCSTACWWVILKNFDFSLSYPLISVNYIYAVVYAQFILHEDIPIIRYIGIACIIAGVLIMTLKEGKTKGKMQ